jgi:hypothetical protein
MGLRVGFEELPRGESRRPHFPVLVATQAEVADEAWQAAYPDGVRPPFRCDARHLRGVLQDGLRMSSGPPLDDEAWGNAPYHPTPTIIEAARALYARHSVEAISRHDAGAKNLRLTSVGVEEIIERSRADREKAIVFVTGVPGAGKTLVGLNVATRRRTLGKREQSTSQETARLWPSFKKPSLGTNWRALATLNGKAPSVSE